MRIVIVDNEQEVRDKLSGLLLQNHPGYEIIGTAPSGISGLKLIRKERPDLIIMDIHIPEMDGLTMLKVLRREGDTSRVIILTAKADFLYAKEAIDLEIDSYLLKPVIFGELSHALELVERHLARAESGKARVKLENILLAALSGQAIEKELNRESLISLYGFDMNASIGIFMVWLGNYFKEYLAVVKEGLKNVGVSSGLFKVCVLHNAERKRVLAVLYALDSKEETYSYLAQTIVPIVTAQTNKKAVMGLRYCEGITWMQQACTGLFESLDYNLAQHNHSFIYYEKVTQEKWDNLKYPLEIENRSRQAVANMDHAEFKSCSYSFLSICENGKYHPKQIKEACLRYCYVMLNTAKECGRLKEGDLPVQTLLQSIMRAVTWEQMLEVLNPFFEQILSERVKREEKPESLIIRRARNMILEYYNQGITLEEIARKLYISEEYLSTRFKKETGMTFTETIRKCRVEKVSELLLATGLKLKQIAAMTGYSDPKYMSKVFKEETGLLPLEYRKMNI